MTNGKVSLRDILNLNEVIDAKLDKMTVKLEKTIFENTKRITTLEYWRANVMGKITFAVAALSLAINFGWDYIKSRFDK